MSLLFLGQDSPANTIAHAPAFRAHSPGRRGQARAWAGAPECSLARERIGPTKNNDCGRATCCCCRFCSLARSLSSSPSVRRRAEQLTTLRVVALSGSRLGECVQAGVRVRAQTQVCFIIGRRCRRLVVVAVAQAPLSEQTKEAKCHRCSRRSICLACRLSLSGLPVVLLQAERQTDKLARSGGAQFGKLEVQRKAEKCTDKLRGGATLCA